MVSRRCENILPRRRAAWIAVGALLLYSTSTVLAAGTPGFTLDPLSNNSADAAVTISPSQFYLISSGVARYTFTTVWTAQAVLFNTSAIPYCNPASTLVSATAGAQTIPWTLATVPQDWDRANKSVLVVINWDRVSGCSLEYISAAVFNLFTRSATNSSTNTLTSTSTTTSPLSASSPLTTDVTTNGTSNGTIPAGTTSSNSTANSTSAEGTTSSNGPMRSPSLLTSILFYGQNFSSGSSLATLLSQDIPSPCISLDPIYSWDSCLESVREFPIPVLGMDASAGRNLAVLTVAFPGIGVNITPALIPSAPYSGPTFSASNPFTPSSSGGMPGWLSVFNFAYLLFAAISLVACGGLSIIAIRRRRQWIRARRRHRSLLTQLELLDPNLRNFLSNLDPTLNDTMTVEELQQIPTRIWTNKPASTSVAGVAAGGAATASRKATLDISSPIHTASNTPATSSDSTVDVSAKDSKLQKEDENLTFVPISRIPSEAHSVVSPSTAVTSPSRAPSLRSVRSLPTGTLGTLSIFRGLRRTATDAEGGPNLELATRRSREEDVDLDPILCAICLDTYEEGCVVRDLPCGHTYHGSCVDPWLVSQSCGCPTCRWDARRSKSDADHEGGSSSQPEATTTPSGNRSDPLGNSVSEGRSNAV
ncbi:hypothetical protein M427DRAFT_309417 [Gonapodya prolifera JEL478]|uniref:RING-type domain-containing protein n=1 Tax=Gonapodya prolifera (strain JEL478) TaxID=1344416 RepID=A0A139AG70_GONPJ|nr:hypothetical protein M427DRAFT_309417 [Gonapodya prolifera JEL478]|eukprot:KXS15822.1 hypothetical protein M427DRAFT_309417 [Gonapodya prolifera JEL478]